ncbi:GNAT family N-acetyltransferase [Streptosporangium pseudovulgare]|uniref:Acetyltransferase, GNAT n=1 Tax=Streptosporangium pseudovulgare TaxID=35765 RepID=A0ABQ2RFS6_9ACTN|nr:GNAT family N-acetyltransferase [Streptosporangium pseudovulgare]GGQ24783.1 putative acetyltransferase, GNAT [Streptosporangium pseudovulgare]
MTLQWRPLTKDDVERWATLLAEVEKADRIGENYGAEDLTDDLDNPLLDLAEGTLAAWDGDRMVAFGLTACGSAADPAHRMHLWAAVHPEYRRRGLGRHVLDWAVRNTPVLHERRHPGRPLELHTGVFDGNEGATALMRTAGMAPSRWFFTMGRDLGTEIRPAALPAGLRIVPYRADLADAARGVRNAAFTDHWGSVPHTPESWERTIVGVHAFRPEDSYLVQDESGRGVAVLITHYYEADTQATGIREAWIQIIGTVREWRGKGVAGALLAHALGEFRARGYRRAALGVDADNPTGALGVYSRAGFEVENRTTTYVLRLAGEASGG